MIRMEWGNRSRGNAYLDRAMFYSYLLRGSYISQPRSRVQRQRLHQHQMQRMGREACSIGSGLLQIEGCPVGAHSGIDRRRDSLESQLASLQRERRMHEVATWRDTTRLWADLGTAMGDLEADRYLQAHLAEDSAGKTELKTSLQLIAWRILGEDLELTDQGLALVRRRGHLSDNVPLLQHHGGLDSVPRGAPWTLATGTHCGPQPQNTLESQHARRVSSQR